MRILELIENFSKGWRRTASNLHSPPLAVGAKCSHALYDDGLRFGAVLSRFLLSTVAMLSLSACGSLIDFIAPPDIEQPAELREFEPKIKIQTLWSDAIPSVADYLNLKPALDQDRLYVAGGHGQVRALDAATGDAIWTVDLEVPLSAGPGVGEGLVLLGTSDAEIIALSAEDGELRWRSRVSSEILATPVAAFGRVVARTLDGKVIGLDAKDGIERWRYLRDAPVLSLRGESSPVLNGLQVLCGMDGGKLVALDVRTGQLAWESTIALSTGRSELDRLVDIDGDPVIYRGSVYVTAYQGGVAALGEYSGTVLWRRELSAYSQPATEGDELYVADADGVIHAFDNQTGASLWQQNLFQRRQLSDVAILGNFVAVGDYAGYVHFLLRQDGRQAARVRVGDAPIRKGLLSVGDVLYVQGETGALQALRLEF